LNYKPEAAMANQEGIMNSQKKSWIPVASAALLLLAAVSIAGCSSSKPTAKRDASVQSTFATPADAGQALQAAAKAKDETTLAKILGPSAKPILSSGDPAEDNATLESFVSKYDQMNRWVPMTDGTQILNIGADNFPFPIPLARDASSKWYFNTKAGADEILKRQIGRNELLAIDACSAIGNAEELYFKTSHDGAPAHQYTTVIISSPGKQDGLYWEAPAGKPSSPLGNLNEFAKTALSTSTPADPLVIDGYSFRVLTAQGDKAKGGAKNYVVGGKQTAGFAVIASPVKYRDSGVATFIMSREGVVFEKDLGPSTTDAAAAIKEYNPTEGWEPAEQ
jgi:Protein of unknown function (DUF2950)